MQPRQLQLLVSPWVLCNSTQQIIIGLWRNKINMVFSFFQKKIEWLIFYGDLFFFQQPGFLPGFLAQTALISVDTPHGPPTAPKRTPGVTTPAPDRKLYFFGFASIWQTYPNGRWKSNGYIKICSKPSGGIEDLASSYPKMPGLSRNSSRNKSYVELKMANFQFLTTARGLRAQGALVPGALALGAL